MIEGSAAEKKISCWVDSTSHLRHRVGDSAVSPSSNRISAQPPTDARQLPQPKGRNSSREIAGLVSTLDEDVHSNRFPLLIGVGCAMFGRFHTTVLSSDGIC